MISIVGKALPRGIFPAPLTATLAIAVLFAPGDPLANELPRVHLIATGGTIAGAANGSLKADGLTELVPELATTVAITTEDFSSIGSSRMSPELQFRLANRIRKLLKEQRDLAGIVITHGTDSLEETAFFLDLLVPGSRPIVFTAAQRPPRLTDSDGARNLLNAIRLAASPSLEGLGVLVTLNDEIHAARDVRKTHSIALNAFVSPWVGPIGAVDEDRIFLYHRPLRRLELEVEAIEPNVALVRLVAGSDGRQIRDAAEAGARGLVIEVFGGGNVPLGVMQAVCEARKNGVVVAFASRTGGGRVVLNADAHHVGVLSAEDLDGLKARLVLVAALGTTTDLETLQGYFRTLAGEVD